MAVELPTAEIGRWRVLANCSAAPEARVRRHEGSLTTVQAVVPRHQENTSATLVTSGAPQPSVLPRRTLHGAAACSSSADGGRITHGQLPQVRTTRADTIAATATCCGRSVAELQGCWVALWLREQANGPRLGSAQKVVLLSHLSRTRFFPASRNAGRW